MSTGWIVTFATLGVVVLFFLWLIVKSLISARERKRQPKAAKGCERLRKAAQTHSNVYRDPEYDPAAFIQNGGLTQYPGGWAPGSRSPIPANFEEQGSRAPGKG